MENVIPQLEIAIKNNVGAIHLIRMMAKSELQLYFSQIARLKQIFKETEYERTVYPVTEEGKHIAQYTFSGLKWGASVIEEELNVRDVVKSHVFLHEGIKGGKTTYTIVLSRKPSELDRLKEVFRDEIAVAVDKVFQSGDGVNVKFDDIAESDEVLKVVEKWLDDECPLIDSDQMEIIVQEEIYKRIPNTK